MLKVSNRGTTNRFLRNIATIIYCIPSSRTIGLTFMAISFFSCFILTKHILALGKQDAPQTNPRMMILVANSFIALTTAMLSIPNFSNSPIFDSSARVKAIEPPNTSLSLSTEQIAPLQMPTCAWTWCCLRVVL